MWRRQGRLALLAQRCAHPELLNVHLSGVQGRGNHVPAIEDAEYARCVHAMTAGVAASDVPKYLPMAEQAARFRYVVHVEGVAGWADRFRHLLLSGALVLKQEMGVVEWFEPLLKPFVHYVPVSSTLHNLSKAIRWAREHDAEARRIANAGVRRMRELSSVRAMAYYQAQVFRHYARLYRRGAAGMESDDWPLPGKRGNRSYPNITSTASFRCRVEGSVEAEEEEIERQRACHFLVPKAGDSNKSRAVCGARLHCELVCTKTGLSRCAMAGIADISGDGYHHRLPPGC